MQIVALILTGLCLLISLFGLFYATAEEPGNPVFAKSWAIVAVAMLFTFALASGLIESLVKAF